ncbi:extracellular solute-binding protein [candidate division KSB1 bacterium]|nr:extracellular solute-binding protein [candidate division KSB1 bacterium]
MRTRILSPCSKFLLVAISYLLLVRFAGLCLASDNLIIVSPHWEGIKVEFGEAFREVYQQQTGRDVELKWLNVGGTSEMLKYLRSEYKSKPGGIDIDIIFGGGIEPYEELKKLALLESYRVPDHIFGNLASDLNGVPLYDKNFYWYAATMAGFGIMYNKVVLERLGLPEPQTWDDLTRPEIYSWIGSADPRKSGSVHAVYEIILQAYGWEHGWRTITAIGANVRAFTAHASQIPKDVALGEVAYGLAIDSYAWNQVNEVGSDLIGFIMPRDLTVFNGDGIGILKGAPNRAVAERFIDFVLSERGQKLWILNQGEPGGPRNYQLSKFSVHPKLYPQISGHTSVTINPFEWKSSFVYDSETGSDRWELLNDLIGSFIVEPHRQLKTTWKAELERTSYDSALNRIMLMSVSLDSVNAILAEKRWDDPVYNKQKLNAWASQVRQALAPETGGWLLNLPAIIALAVVMLAAVNRRRRRDMA